jgi:SAM-dependent methyltransferase
MSDRSYQKELLDDLTVPFEEIQLNMHELNLINHWLGGHRITLEGIRKLLGKQLSGNPLVLEIGCGGGDNLKVVNRWAVAKRSGLRLVGVDINPACIAYARDAFPRADYLVSDYRQTGKDIHPDVIFSSLFCHHFTNDELVTQLRWMYERAEIGFFINDLHRHPLAYWSIRLLTSLFSKSRLVRHDAPVSVKRGFTRSDWKALLQRAGISEAEIRWKWAFRWLIIVKKNSHAGSKPV